GEKWLGAARDVSHMAMVTLGTGIGGGIVLNGKIWHGMNGMAGEFGHNPIEFEGYPCGCGSNGCAEQYASASAVVRMAREIIRSGEKWLGAARDVSHMAMVTLGTGIGGGIVLNGKIWHGMNGMAGEFGHNPIEFEGYPCGCGSNGCAEQYASASAVVRMAREIIASGKATARQQAAGTDPEFAADS